MGYTHYWSTDPLPTLAEVGRDVEAIVFASELPIVGWDGDPSTPIEYGQDRIALNGNRMIGQGCETFALTTRGGWEFCKTRQMPYDVIVTASLLALKDRFGSMVRLSSDGEPEDWEAGRALAERALHRPIAGFAREETLA